MSALDTLTDADLTRLRIVLSRASGVFAALAERARLQTRDYPEHAADVREYRELAGECERIIEAMATASAAPGATSTSPTNQRLTAERGSST